MLETKIAQARRLFLDGDEDQALAMIARWPSLGKHREKIKTGYEASRHPRIYSQMGIDTEQAYTEAITAARELVGA